MEKIEKRMVLLNTGSNAAGALLSFIFLSVIYPVPQTQQAVRTDVGWANILLFIIITGALLFVGSKLDDGTDKQVKVWYQRIAHGEVTASAVPDRVRKAVINYVPRGVVISLFMWLLAGLAFSLMNITGEAFSLASYMRYFTGIFGVGGVLTAAMTFFGSDLIWRPVIPVFFPDGDTYNSGGVRISVFRRLLVVFLLVTVWPLLLLVTLSLQRAGQIVGAENPQAVLNNLMILETFILVVSIVASVVMALLVTRGITAPIERLQAAMSRVEHNQLDVRVTVDTSDELGYLGEGFNRMTAGLRRGELLRNLLNLYVTPEVAREAIEHGTPLGGRLVECSVLFADIRDFTGLAERMAPDQLIALLNRYMDGMVGTVVAHGGMVNKFGGDSLLVVFGTPLNPAPDHAARALLAARAMLNCLDAFNQDQRARSEPEIRIGIGLATGNVVAGNLGGKERIEYTVIGDTVNLAARLQAMTKEIGQVILASAVTIEQAGPVHGLESVALPAMPVRGKEEKVAVFGVYPDGIYAPLNTGEAL